jgi:hypothetical protein
MTSDNVITSYLVLDGKKVVQNTATNRKKNVTSVLQNGSDNLLLTVLDSLMGCKPVTGRDLAETTFASFIPSLALNEIAAARQQQAPQAIIPDNDPMATVDGIQNQAKVNLYRVGVNQPIGVPAPAKEYCQNYSDIAPPRLLANKALLLKAPTLDAATGDTLFTFLAARFVNSFGADGLNCVGLGLTSPITVTVDGTGAAIDAVITINGNNNTGAGAGNNNNVDPNAIIGGAVGGIGGVAVLGGAFLLMRRRSRRSMDRGGDVRLAATNPGFSGNNGGYQQNNGGGGGFTSSFRNMGQNFNPSQWGQSIRQSFMPSPAKWGQSMRQSMMRFGGFGSGGGLGGGAPAAPTSPMASNPGPSFGGQSQYGGGPSYGGPSYGGAPSASFQQPPYGGAPPRSQAPSAAYQQQGGGYGGGGGGGGPSRPFGGYVPSGRTQFQ